MDTPTFPRFHDAPKCDPALLLQPPERPLDRPARKRLSASAQEWGAWAAILLGVICIGWLAYHDGAIERRVAALEQIEATREADRVRIFGSEETLDLQAADQERAAVVRPIDRLISEGRE